ncbi:MAG: CRISPR-associated helicase Cas3', partial [Candidatus Saccharimonadales bacterium]
KEASTISELYPLESVLAEQHIREMAEEVPFDDVAALATWVLELREGGPRLDGAAFNDPGEFARRFRSDSIGLILRTLEEYQWLVRELHKGRQHPLLLAGLALRGMVVLSDHIGSAHAQQSLHPAFRVDTASSARKPGPWSHQLAAEHVSGSTIFIAPTGSGKTETAILWACRQNSLRKVPHVFYVLPYQASMNAMHQRLRASFSSVALIHGRALEATYRQLLEDDDARPAAVRKARAEENLARLQVHGVRVLSPYQLLKVLFRLKGYEALSADFFDSAFIYDELHAYEPRRLALIIGQMADLVHRFGARVCVMSATLPSFLQEWLRDAIPELGDTVRASQQEFLKFRRHRIAVHEGDLLDQIGQIARRLPTSSALICCNTIKRAQEAYGSLRRQGIDAVLLHSRFSTGDRLEKERVLDPGREQRIVMVATQVVEVSLDVSFATIYT